MKYRVKNRPNNYHDSYIKTEYITEYSITSLNRYKHSTKYLLADDKLVTGNLNPWDRAILSQNSSQYIVAPGEENRIDLVAAKVYGNSALYWVLCYMNKIEDPLNIPVGTFLLVPRLSEVFQGSNPLA